jgi:hypothetical protein
MIYEITGKTIIDQDGNPKLKSIKGLVLANDIISAITLAEEEMRSLCATADKTISVESVKLLKAEYLKTKDFCGETVWSVHVADEENNTLCVFVTAEDTRKAENAVTTAYMEYNNVISVKKTNIIYILNE